MPSIQETITKIRGYCRSDEPQMTPEWDTLAAHYAEECGLANQRLTQSCELIRQGKRKDAIKQADNFPSLVDLCAILDFRESEIWDELCQRANKVREENASSATAVTYLARAPKILDLLALELNQAYAASPRVKALVKLNCLMAVADAPIHDRIRVARELVETDVGIADWAVQCEALERKRHQELQDAWREAWRREDSVRLDMLKQEICSSEWKIARPPDRLIEETLKPSNDKERANWRHVAGLTRFQAQIDSLLKAFETSKREPLSPLGETSRAIVTLRELLNLWQRTCEEYFPKIAPTDKHFKKFMELESQVRPVRNWLQQQYDERRRAAEQAAADAQRDEERKVEDVRLEELLAKKRVSLQELDQAWQSRSKYDFPEELKERVNRRRDAIKDRVIFFRTLLICGAIAVLATSVTGYWLHHRHKKTQAAALVAAETSKTDFLNSLKDQLYIIKGNKNSEDLLSIDEGKLSKLESDLSKAEGDDKFKYEILIEEIRNDVDKLNKRQDELKTSGAHDDGVEKKILDLRKFIDNELRSTSVPSAGDVKRLKGRYETLKNEKFTLSDNSLHERYAELVDRGDKALSALTRRAILPDLASRSRNPDEVIKRMQDEPKLFENTSLAARQNSIIELAKVAKRYDDWLVIVAGYQTLISESNPAETHKRAIDLRDKLADFRQPPKLSDNITDDPIPDDAFKTAAEKMSRLVENVKNVCEPEGLETEGLSNLIAKLRTDTLAQTLTVRLKDGGMYYVALGTFLPSSINNVVDKVRFFRVKNDGTKANNDTTVVADLLKDPSATAPVEAPHAALMTRLESLARNRSAITASEIPVVLCQAVIDCKDNDVDPIVKILLLNELVEFSKASLANRADESAQDAINFVLNFKAEYDWTDPNEVRIKPLRQMANDFLRNSGEKIPKYLKQANTNDRDAIEEIARRRVAIGIYDSVPDSNIYWLGNVAPPGTATLVTAIGAPGEPMNVVEVGQYLDGRIVIDKNRTSLTDGAIVFAVAD